MHSEVELLKEGDLDEGDVTADWLLGGKRSADAFPRQCDLGV